VLLNLGACATKPVRLREQPVSRTSAILGQLDARRRLDVGPPSMSKKVLPSVRILRC